MRMMNVSRKFISILLCISLVFSFATFLAVNTVAAAGSYTWRVRVEVLDNFDSTSDGDSKKSYITIKGGEKNGSEPASIVIDQKKIEKNVITDYDDGTSVYLTNLLNSNDVGASTSNTQYTTSYFPTYFYMNLYKTGHAGFGNANYKTHLEVKNSSGSWIDLCSDSEKKTGGWGDMDVEATVPANMMPQASSIKFTKTPKTSLTVPRIDQQTVEEPYEVTVYDQYGIVWYDPATVNFTVYHTGVGVNNGVITVSSEANSVDGSNTALVLRATYSTLTASVNITLTNASYTYKFESYDGSQISAGTLKYGQTIPKPADPTKPRTDKNHFVFTGWNNTVGTISRDIVFKPEFQTVKHSFDNYVYNGDATCLEDGTETATCVCGMTDTRVKENTARGHDPIPTVVAVANCTQSGRTDYKCSRCDYAYTEIFDALDHNYSTTPHQPTCEEEGYDEHICARCGDTYNDNFVPKLGHDYDDGVLTLEPSCTETGTKVFTCKRCSYEDPRVLEALGHDYGDWTVQTKPGCEKEGLKTCTCQRCLNFIPESIPATGHAWTDWFVETPETCEVDGELARYCPTCGEVETEVIQAPGHDIQLVQQKPTDGTPGCLYYACTHEGCNKIQACVINAAGQKSMGAECASIDEALENSAAIIPTTTFNQFTRTESEFRYKDRLASLRIDQNSAEDIQPIRFCASMTVPKGAQIIDFGYVFTTETLYKKYVKSPAKFVIDGSYVDYKSMINGNYSSFEVEDGTVLTFNVVILCKSDHWAVKMFARPYISFIYAGDTYDVYDTQISRKSVSEIASKVVANPNEPKFIKDYLKAKLGDMI